MQNLATVATQVGILFALMAVGAVCRRTRLVDGPAVKGIVNLLIMVVTPCIIVDVFQRPFEQSMLRSFLMGFAISFAAHIALIAIARLTARGDAKSLPVLRLATVFSNAGFMGIPLEYAILGPKGVFYGIVYVATFNLFIWSWGLVQMRDGERNGESSFAKAPAAAKALAGKVEDNRRTGKRVAWQDVRPMVLNPGTFGLVLGLPLFLFSVTLPSIVKTPVHLLSELNTPLAMVVIGFYLAGADFRRVIRTPAAYVSAFVRLVAFPLLMIGALWFLRGYVDRMMSLAIVIASSAPVAAMVTMFASKYERDVDLSVGLVSGTTLLSIATMPPVIALGMEVL
jgi:hypothetical protein